MTKKELAAKVAAATHLSPSDAINTIDAMMEVIAEALAHKEKVTLRGFGALKVKTRKGKSARDIVRNVQVWVPEHNVAKFIPSKKLIARINNQ